MCNQKLNGDVSLSPPWWGSKGIAPLIPDHCTRCRWVVNYMPWPLYSVKESLYQLNRRAGWAPKPVWTFLWRENPLFLAENLTLDRPVLRLDAIPTKLSRFLYLDLSGRKWPIMWKFMDHRSTMQRTGMQFVRLLQLGLISSWYVIVTFQRTKLLPSLINFNHSVEQNIVSF